LAESGLHGKSIERRWEGSLEMSQQIAGKRQNRIVLSGKGQSYHVGIDPIVSELSCRPARPCRSAIIFQRFLEGADKEASMIC
jgi:hypothetical protein